jgi:hypothetical protein
MHKCIECAFKHVTDAKKTYSELRMGYATDPSHVGNFSSDMSHAAQHLYEDHQDLANRLRDDRLIVLDQLFSDVGELTYRPPFEEYEGILFEMIKEEQTVGQEEDSQEGRAQTGGGDHADSPGDAG